MVIQTFNGNRLTDVITAKRFFWRDSVWVGTDVTIKKIGNLDQANQPITIAQKDTVVFSGFKEKPNYFEDWFSRQDALSMGYFKLRKFIEVSRALGKDVTRQIVDLYNKISFPFINVIIILIGVSLASNPRRAGLGISFGLSMGISFVFYTMVKVAIEMGHNGMLDPIVASWGTNAVFLVFGIFLLIRVPK